MKNILIKGAPGTGKTIISRAIPYYIFHEQLDIKDVLLKDIYLDIGKIETFAQSEFVEYIQVHPSMSYEDIVYGIEISNINGLSMEYSEKRIKQICERANNSSKEFFIILDDIGRVDSGKLLGNLLYAMEYRKEPVALIDGSTITIPANVYIIVTECKALYGNPLDYALRRRFNFEIELLSESSVLDRYYNNVLSFGVREIILSVFEKINNFIISNASHDPSIKSENYIPGHGMLMVSRDGSENDILIRIKEKFEYQLFPYITHLLISGIIACDSGALDDLYSIIKNQLNVGEKTINNSTSVEKIFCNSQKQITTFGLKDSHDYYMHTIVPNGCEDYRAIIENICDAIFKNGIFPIDKALSDIMLNTNVIRFEHRTRPGTYAAFLAEKNENQNYGYYTTVSNGNLRSYYSSNQCRTGRWAQNKDAPAYKVLFPNQNTKTYVPLNAFRDVGFDITTSTIHAKENTASIYLALYHLIKTYLSVYETNLSLLSSIDSNYSEINQLVSFEKAYWEVKNVESQELRGSKTKIKNLGEAVLNLRTLWNPVGTIIEVDDTKFNNLALSSNQISITKYEDLYNITGTKKLIELKGVDTMVDLNNYQKIMENIGVRQMIFQGPPGTSKTFESKKFILKQLDPNSNISNTLTQDDISNALEYYRLTADDYENPNASSKLKTGGWDIVQFHPSYSYEDFIRGIEVKPVNGTPTYSVANRILGKISEFAKIAETKSTNGEIPKFYLLIDEINRANLATVFGELIYGLEYRDSKISTPYEVNDKIQNILSKDIVLGKNLFIIGTMNTADKSIDSIDYAIRRRFIFIESPAKREVVINCYQNIMGVTDEESIEVLLFDAVGYLFESDRFFNEEYQRNDVRIGHTYFLRNKQEGYIEDTIQRFVYQVIPILKEYLKDGIIDSYEDLINNLKSIDDISSITGENRVKNLAENIMIYVKHFGEKDINGNIIDNNYIANFIEQLCEKLKY